MLQVVNVEALDRAAVAIVGRETTTTILALYKLLDQAMHDGYALGKYEAEQNVEERLDAAFDNGYEHGSIEGRAEGHGEGQVEGWDDGYLEGVQDARAHPELADAIVADIISERDVYAINGEFLAEGWDRDAYDANNVTDSGDEQPDLSDCAGLWDDRYNGE